MAKEKKDIQIITVRVPRLLHASVRTLAWSRRTSMQKVVCKLIEREVSQEAENHGQTPSTDD